MNFFKSVFVSLFFVCVFFQTHAQSYPYCISGRFSENEFFSDLAIQQDTKVFAVATNYSGVIDSLKINVYFPNTNIDPLPERPLILCVHGGEFLSGNKSDMELTARQLARKGYVAATMDYRLGWDAGIANNCNGSLSEYRKALYRSVQDVRAALRFITYHASMYKIDTANLFLLGQDAGAIAAMHTGFMDQVEANQRFPDLEAMLGSLHTSGNNLNETFSLKGIINWCGGIVDTSLIQSDESIPVLSLHGIKDSIMPWVAGNLYYCTNPDFAYQMFYGPVSIHQRLKNIGICSEANYDANGEHCIFPSLEPINYIPQKYTCLLKIFCAATAKHKKKSATIFKAAWTQHRLL
jgi:Carboxylesterase type B